MIITFQADRGFIPYLVCNMNAGSGFRKAKPLARKNIPVSIRMKVGKAFAELHLFPVKCQQPVCAFACLFNLFRNIIIIQAQEPADLCFLELKKSPGFTLSHHMHLVGFHIPEDPGQHIEKMNAYIGCNTTRFGDVSFPGAVIPVSP